MDGRHRTLLGIPRSLDEARAIQESVRQEVAAAPCVSLEDVRTVAGADASYSPDGTRIIAAVAVLGYPDLDTLDSCWVSRESPFPYLPGFFAFREGPAIVSAVAGLTRRPDLLLVDAHGRAHPRGAGMACHVGLALGIPTVGVAKRVLAGTAEEPGPDRGSVSPLRVLGEVTGMAVRTRSGSRPVFVSAGFAMDLETSVAAVLSMTGSFRVPAPIREAHRIAREVSRNSPPLTPGL
jgi:deoxyribonuclease V